MLGICKKIVSCSFDDKLIILIISSFLHRQCDFSMDKIPFIYRGKIGNLCPMLDRDASR
jgi:hypothetical protein